MSAVSSWLLSITGVIILSVLAEFVLPEGQINKYTKVIFSFVILLVIIMPLPKLFGKNFDFSQYFNNTENVLQEDYLYQVNLDKLNALSQQLSQKVEEAGIKNVTIALNADIMSDELEIFDIYADLREIEYDDKFETKDISKAKQTIIEIVRGFGTLKDVEVKFDE